MAGRRATQGNRVARRGAAAVILIGVLLLSGCSGASASTGLNGKWNADGYGCLFATFHHEVVQIVQHGSHIVGTKLVGDQCVRAGSRTFEGTVHGRSGHVDYWLGSPGFSPAIGLRNEQLTVVSADRFTVRYQSGLITYTRLSSARHSSGGSPWWLWLLVAIAASALVGVLFVRRRRRRSPRLTEWGSTTTN